MKAYKISIDLNLHEVDIIDYGINKVKFRQDNSNEKILSRHSFDQEYSFAKIMVLYKLEEILSLQLASIHDVMRSHKLAFNPIDTVDIIYQKYNKNTREVHQYNKITGKYIQSFNSISIAHKAVNGINSPLSGTIKTAAEGTRYSAYGYRWSFKKTNILK